VPEAENLSFSKSRISGATNVAEQIDAATSKLLRMHRLVFFIAFLFGGLSCSYAQWETEESHTTADLRGINNLGNGVVWASGGDGTVLHTTNDGKNWQRCATPPDADKLDFRGIQAFDANVAIVMSSGKGPLSRLYKTTDGCQTWTLLFTNPDPEGFWDAIAFQNRRSGWLLGDPVSDSFSIFVTRDAGEHWIKQLNSGLAAKPSEQRAFAASNSSLFGGGGFAAFATGGVAGAAVYFEISSPNCLDYCPSSGSNRDGSKDTWLRVDVPAGSRTESSGIFSMNMKGSGQDNRITIAVGGDYKAPDASERTAVYFDEKTKHWAATNTPPHGYRSAVAYDSASKTWITVGPNGTDISTDDGRNWRALKPTVTEPPDADQHWNALSLPFVAGPHGRIGKLNAKALAP
jgi:photosystem II stability/assembly factor-like uncharacterized protein